MAVARLQIDLTLMSDETWLQALTRIARFLIDALSAVVTRPMQRTHVVDVQSFFERTPTRRTDEFDRFAATIVDDGEIVEPEIVHATVKFMANDQFNEILGGDVGLHTNRSAEHVIETYEQGAMRVADSEKQLVPKAIVDRYLIEWQKDPFVVQFHMDASNGQLNAQRVVGDGFLVEVDHLQQWVCLRVRPKAERQLYIRRRGIDPDETRSVE